MVHGTGSVTRATERLDHPQAAVSWHIELLKAECGTLQLRKPHQQELAPRGLLVVDFAYQQPLATGQLRNRLYDDYPHRGAITLATPRSPPNQTQYEVITRSTASEKQRTTCRQIGANTEKDTENRLTPRRLDDTQQRGQVRQNRKAKSQLIELAFL